MFDQPALRITVRSTTHGMVICPDGEIDVATAGRLTSAMTAIDLDRCRQVTVDLAAVTYMDVRGLRALLEAHLTLARHGIAFDVVHPRPVVRRLLEVSGTTHLLSRERRGDRDIIRLTAPGTPPAATIPSRPAG